LKKIYGRAYRVAGDSAAEISDLFLFLFFFLFGRCVALRAVVGRGVCSPCHSRVGGSARYRTSGPGRGNR